MLEQSMYLLMWSYLKHSGPGDNIRRIVERVSAVRLSPFGWVVSWCLCWIEGTNLEEIQDCIGQEASGSGGVCSAERLADSKAEPGHGFSLGRSTISNACNACLFLLYSFWADIFVSESALFDKNLNSFDPSDFPVWLGEARTYQS